MSDEAESCAERLNRLVVDSGLKPLDPQSASRFQSYLSLILRWNSRTNLTAIRDVEGILTRHFVESIACAQGLPDGITSLLDFGSGAGFPGIPIAICRPEISVTLAESQNKKAAFLQEAVRTLGIHAKVHSARAETLHEPFDCVVLRAVDRMLEAVATAATLVGNNGWLAFMTTSADFPGLRMAAGRSFDWIQEIRPAGTEIIAMARKGNTAF